MNDSLAAIPTGLVRGLTNSSLCLRPNLLIVEDFAVKRGVLAEMLGNPVPEGAVLWRSLALVPLFWREFSSDRGGPEGRRIDLL